MAAPTLLDLPDPYAQFRPSQDTRRPDGKIIFPVEAAKWREVKVRIANLKAYLRRYPDLPHAEARDLLRMLEKGVATQVPPQTPACPVFTERFRHRLIGNIWPLVEDELAGRVLTGTLMPTGLWVPANALHLQHPKMMLRRLYSDLDRIGVTALAGFVMAGLHAEFDPRREGYDFHYHLVAGGWKARALDDLRGRPKYQDNRREPHQLGMDIPPRIRLTRQVLTNLPDPLTYVTQYWISNRPTRVVNYSPLRVERIRGHRRMPNPYHTQWMIWMNRWSVTDFILLNGIRAAAGGFTYTHA